MERKDPAYWALLSNDAVFPESYEWFVIVAHIGILAVGVVGHFALMSAMFSNDPKKRTNHNENDHRRLKMQNLLANLSVADILRLLIVLPPTLLSDVTDTWFFGLEACKVVGVVDGLGQTVTLAQTTLTAFALWKLSKEEKKRPSMQQRSQSETPPKIKSNILSKATIIIWCSSLMIAFVEANGLRLSKPQRGNEENEDTKVLFTRCELEPSRSLTFDGEKRSLAKAIVLFALPICLTLTLLILTNIKGKPTYSTSSESNAMERVKRDSMTLGMLTAVYFVTLLPTFFADQFVQLGVWTQRRGGLYSSYDGAEKMVGQIRMMTHWLAFAGAALNPIVVALSSEDIQDKLLDLGPQRGRYDEDVERNESEDDEGNNSAAAIEVSYSLYYASIESSRPSAVSSSL